MFISILTFIPLSQAHEYIHEMTMAKTCCSEYNVFQLFRVFGGAAVAIYFKLELSSLLMLIKYFKLYGARESQSVLANVVPHYVIF